MCTTDAYSANFLTEASIAGIRGEPEQSDNLHVTCDIHKSAGCHTKTFSLIADHISGMLNCFLSLRQGAAMVKFRRCLYEEIKLRLHILPGRCPPSAVDFKKKVVRLFCSHGASLVTRRMLLAVFPNGDWRSKRVEHYVGNVAIESLNRDAVAERMAAGMLVALCNSSHRLYPRSRWTGADLATDDLGILECVHRLLSTS